jgi:hypothetical protein
LLKILAKVRFLISLELDRRKYKLLVEQVYISDRVEHFKLSARNSSILLESNRPIFINKGLKHRRPDWKLKEGNVKNMSLLQKAIEAIEAHLRY